MPSHRQHRATREVQGPGSWSDGLTRAVSGDAVRLALAHLGVPTLPPWSRHDETTLRAAGARYLARHADAARHLAPHLDRLVGGIALVPFLEPGGPFGPAWPGHALASPAMRVGYRLREPDLTRELAALMGPAAGHQGRRRAIGFLRLLTELAGADAVRETLNDDIRPTVSAELPVPVTRARLTDSDAPSGRAPAASRIDLLFEWPLGSSGRQAVVVIEAKLGAGVADGQLRPYRAEALRRARGGPVGLILLTARPDPAERRHRAWTAVRWPALLRRWEAVLADAGDVDPEFARLRAHLWRHLLPLRRTRS